MQTRGVGVAKVVSLRKIVEFLLGASGPVKSFIATDHTDTSANSADVNEPSHQDLHCLPFCYQL